MGGLARGLVGLLGLAAMALAVAWLSGAFETRVAPGEVAVTGGAPPPGAKVAEAVRVTAPAFERASGTVAAERRATVSSRILARIVAVRVHAGDTVARGDVLVRLDSRDLRARVEEAKQALDAARARRDLARAEKARYEKLFRRRVVAKQRLDAVLAEADTAEAELARRRQALNEAKTALSYAVIRAPVAGRVVDRLAEPGELAVPGTPLLRVYDPTALRVEVPVRETLAVTLAVGERLEVEIPALGRRVTGTIEEIVPFAEPGARTLLIKVGLPPAPKLFAGLFARMFVPAGERARILVPATAVVRIGQLAFVTVVDGEGRAARRAVTLGDDRIDDRVEVLSGLGDGERVVIP